MPLKITQLLFNNIKNKFVIMFDYYSNDTLRVARCAFDRIFVVLRGCLRVVSQFPVLLFVFGVTYHVILFHLFYSIV